MTKHCISMMVTITLMITMMVLITMTIFFLLSMFVVVVILIPYSIVIQKLVNIHHKLYILCKSQIIHFQISLYHLSFESSFIC